MRVAVVGAGRVGCALARLLSAAGHEFLGAASRSLASAREACRLAGSGRAGTDPAAPCRGADLVLITTPDDAVASVCRAIAAAGGFRKGAVVAHTSGVHSSAILAPARECGAFTAGMHPLQSFAGVEQATRLLPGSWFCIEGEPEAVRVLGEVAGALGGRVLAIPTAGKALYHAAAVVASNYLVALEDAALALAQEAGLDRESALRALLSLVRGTVDNIENVGIPECLTGPIARGDCETVRLHLEAIAARAPGVLPLYCALGLRAVEVAVARGLARERAEELRRLLSARP